MKTNTYPVGIGKSTSVSVPKECFTLQDGSRIHTVDTAIPSVEKSQWRVDKSVLLLKESIAIETLQYQYTWRTLKTKRVKDMSCLSGFDQY